MNMKLYKYISPDIINKVFPLKGQIIFKCSYPKDFNDPYELFLTLDFNEPPEMLAFYSEVIGEIPQIPTTCFSRSPSIIPMWAHYAQNLKGFVIELDEQKLASHFPESNFGDVEYLDEPNDSIKYNLHLAHTTAKARHIYFLQQGVVSTAYLTKSTYWSYELERRMIIDPKETRNSNGLILIDIPQECVSSIICGPRAESRHKKSLLEKTNSTNCGYFEMKIGRSSSTPFFTDIAGNPYVFKDGALSVPQSYCTKCKEPINIDAKKCSWCMIDESHKKAAAERNIFRILDQFDLLDPYLANMEKINRKYRKK